VAAKHEEMILCRQKSISWFLFFPFLLNGKQSEQFLRMRDINLSAAIYNMLVTAVAKCLKYIFVA